MAGNLRCFQHRCNAASFLLATSASLAVSEEELLALETKRFDQMSQVERSGVNLAPREYISRLGYTDESERAIALCPHGGKRNKTLFF